MSPRLLVLGAGGFIGRSFADHVLARGDVELVLHYRNADERYASGIDVESHALDLLACQTGAIAQMIDRVRPDVVVNCTGLIVGRPHELWAANVEIVTRLIDELDGHGSVRLVQLGSAAEYGVHQHGYPVSETTFANPISDYGASKLEATEQLLSADTRGRISVTVLRLFNPVGRFSPATTLPGRAAREIDQALRTGADTITLGALDSWRDYIDVRDISSAVLAAAAPAAPSGLVLNVGRGEAVGCLHLVRSLASIAGYDGDIVETDVASARSEHVDWQCADIGTIRQTLGWSAEYSIEDSLADLWSEIVRSTEFADG